MLYNISEHNIKRMSQNNLSVKLKSNKKRKLSSTLWLKRQLNDPYVYQAKKDGYRARAAYKLLEIDQKFKILKRDSIVVDLGAAPGSWSQIAIERKAKKVIAIDLLPMDPISNVDFIQGDFMDDEVLIKIDVLTSGNRVDVIFSDMSPNISGNRNLDHLRIITLCESVFEFAKANLAEGGAMVVKIFQGGTENTLLQKIKQNFGLVKHFKPKASRKESGEMYLVATEFHSNTNSSF